MTLPAGVWIDAAKERPPIDQIVIVSYKSGHDGKPTYAWGARLEGDEGWCWGVSSGVIGLRPDHDACWNDIQTDDEYEVTHWMPLPKPPLRRRKRKAATADLSAVVTPGTGDTP